jgi:hypothetical protein
MNSNHLRNTAPRFWLRILVLTILCTLVAVAGLVAGFAQLVLGAKVLLLSSLIVVCLTLAIFALIVAFSSVVPLRRREFGDWL